MDRLGRNTLKRYNAIVITPVNIEVDVKVVPEIHCPHDRVYFTGCNSKLDISPDEESKVIKQYIANALQDTADRKLWENKYNNLLKGLEYWKRKANGQDL